MSFENENLPASVIIDFLERCINKDDSDVDDEVGETALLIAAIKLIKDSIDHLIRRQVDVHSITWEGEDTITHCLVKNLRLRYDRAFSKMSDTELEVMEKESASFINWLIATGFDFELRNSDGETALSQSLDYGLQHIALVILKHTKQLKVTYNGGKNLLHQFFNVNGFLRRKYHKIEAEKWHNFNSRYASKIVKILLDKGVYALLMDDNHDTPLCMAVVREESLDIIDMLLDRLVWSERYHQSDVARTVLIELFKASGWWGEESRTQYFLKVARSLIAKGTDVNFKDPLGKTAVYYAFEAQNPRAAEFLNENGADFSILYECDRNLYHVLAYSYQSSNPDQREALFDLLANKTCCDVNARDCGGGTPLHRAAEVANLTIARKLIQQGTDVNARDSFGRTAAYYAFQCQNRPAIIDMLNENGADFGILSNDGSNLFHVLADFWYSRNADQQEALFDFLASKACCDVNARGYCAKTPLHCAARAANLTIARKLIQQGADVNARDSFGRTAVYYAFGRQNRLLIDVLGNNGADFSIVCDDGRNLFHVLADSRQSSDEGQQEALFDLLADKICCDVNARGHRAETPLHCAARAKNLTITRKLIQHGADVNAKDSGGSTALHFAVKQYNKDDVVELLLASGAEVNCKDLNGQRPLACVTKWTCRSSVSLLLKWGALVNDYQDGESTFSRVFLNTGFKFAREMLAYGLDINDDRICAFFNSQNHLGHLTGFFSRHWIKHKVAKLPCSDYYKYFESNCEADRKYHENCLREVAKLKSTFINSQTSLYDYLHMDFESRFIYNHNEELKNLVNQPDLLEQEFAEYSVLILARYRNAVRWKSLLEPAKGAWLRLTHVALPDVCIEIIFAYLSIEDLVVLIVDVAT